MFKNFFETLRFGVHRRTMDFDEKRRKGNTTEEEKEKEKEKEKEEEEEEESKQTEVSFGPRRPVSSLISSLAFSRASSFSLSFLYFLPLAFVCLFSRRRFRFLEEG